MTRLDEKLNDLTLAEKMEVVRRVRVGSLTLRDGDRVATTRRLCGSYTHEGLEDEGEDYRIPYDVPAGTLGRIITVRQYVTPLPYRVLFDNDVELSLAQGDVERVAS